MPRTGTSAPATTPPTRALGMPLGLSSENLRLLILFFGGALLIAVISRIGWGSGTIEDFNKQKKLWLKAPQTATDGPTYLRGKVLPVTVNLVQLEGPDAYVSEELYKKLPSELRPRTPEEVDTLAWIAWREEKLLRSLGNFYQDVGKRYHCKVSIIDRKTNTKVGERSFTGSDPRGSGEYEGEKPYAQILDYLTGLPRK
jgi:hypothetical protein